MKIGIVSDIHAYLDNFKDALTIFEEHNVDKIICAGDIVDGGQDGDAVVQLIRERGIDTVLGNHDRDVFADQAWVRRNMRVSGETMNPLLLMLETVAYVSQLPVNLTFNWEGLHICLAHGIPNNNTQYLFSDSPDARFHEALAQTDADILILGHTHEPMIAQIGNRYILNAGSVSINRFDDSRTCAVLTLPELHFDVFNLDTCNLYHLNKKSI